MCETKIDPSVLQFIACVIRMTALLQDSAVFLRMCYNACNNHFAFPSHSSIYTAILNNTLFLFSLVYIVQCHTKTKFVQHKFYHCNYGTTFPISMIFHVPLCIKEEEAQRHKWLTFQCPIMNSVGIISSNSIYHMFLGLWSEISLFHKLIYDMAQGSILIGLNIAVRLWRHR